MYGIYVQATRAIDYAISLVKGYKRIETRTRDVFKNMDKRDPVAIIRTGRGRKPEIVGFVLLMPGYHCPAERFQDFFQPCLGRHLEFGDGQSHIRALPGLPDPVEKTVSEKSEQFLGGLPFGWEDYRHLIAAAFIQHIHRTCFCRLHIIESLALPKHTYLLHLSRRSRKIAVRDAAGEHLMPC